MLHVRQSFPRGAVGGGRHLVLHRQQQQLPVRAGVLRGQCERVREPAGVAHCSSLPGACNGAWPLCASAATPFASVFV